MTSLWLVRHGQTDWNFAGQWQGQSSKAPGLNDVGRAQALALQYQLKNIQLCAIYSSDLLRSQQTAELIATPLGLRVNLESRLREMKLGKWEGLTLEEIKARFPQNFAQRTRDPVNTRAPNGESPIQVAKRVTAAVTEIATKHPDGTAMIVAHGVPLAIVTCLARGIPLDRLYEYIPDNSKLSHVEWKISRYSEEIVQRNYSQNLSLIANEKG